MEDWVNQFKKSHENLKDIGEDLAGMDETDLALLKQSLEENIINLNLTLDPLKAKVRAIESARTDMITLKWKVETKLTPVQVIKPGAKRTPKPLGEDDQILYKNMSVSQLIKVLGEKDAMQLIKRGRYYNY